MKGSHILSLEGGIQSSNGYDDNHRLERQVDDDDGWHRRGGGKRS